MTTELTVLTLAALLQVIQLFLMAVPANLELGPGKTMSPRDPAKLGAPLQDQMSTRTGRLSRVLNNHFEGLILFTIACGVITISGQSAPFTGTLAIIYLIARPLHPSLRIRLDPMVQLHLGHRFYRHYTHADCSSCPIQFAK